MKSSSLFRACLPLLALLLCACTATRPTPPPNVLIGASGHDGGSVLAVDPTSTLVASGGWEGMVRLWRLSNGELVASWQAHAGTVNGLAFSPGGDELISAGYDGVLMRWGLDGKARQKVEHSPPITAFDVSPTGDLAVTGHLDGSLRWWDPGELALRAQAAIHHSPVRAVALSHRQTASSDTARQVTLSDPDGRILRLPDPPTDSRTLAFAPDGASLFGAGWFELYRWDLASGEVEILPTEHRGIIKHIRFTPNGQELASISRQTDSSVLLLDPKNGRSLHVLGKHDLCGGYVMPSPDGRYLVTTSDDASIRIWDRRKLLPAR